MEVYQLNDGLIRTAEAIVRQQLGAEYAAHSHQVLPLLRAAHSEALAEAIWHDAAMLADIVIDRLPETSAPTAPTSILERLTRSAMLPPPTEPPSTVTVAFTISEWNAVIEAVQLAAFRAPARTLGLVLSGAAEKMQSAHIQAALQAARKTALVAS